MWKCSAAPIVSFKEQFPAKSDEHVVTESIRRKLEKNIKFFVDPKLIEIQRA